MNRTDQMTFKFRDVLKQTERLEVEDMRAYQESRLAPLLLHAREHVPFYRDRVAPVFNGDSIDFSKWRDIPVMTRSDAIESRDALTARKVPPHFGAVREEETSGSTGRALRFLTNELLLVSDLSLTDRMYRWWRIDGAKTLVTFTAPKLNAENPQQSDTFGWRTGFIDGPHILRASTGDFDAQLDWLRETRPDYLGVPSGMLRPLAERALERGEKIRFDALISRGGTVDEDIWPLCQKAFKAALVDAYGANEVGQVACQCPHCKMYHINCETVLAEILDRQGEPVAPGDTGRVVLTSFYNFAMPFIRYEIGDYAQLAVTGAECDIRLPRLQRIHGRYRNSFTLRDGRVLFPHPPMSKFADYFAHRQLQVVQTDFDKIEVRFVPGPGEVRTDQAGLEKWLSKALGEDFSVRLVEVDEIPHSPSGKYEDFLSLVERGRSATREG